MPQQENRIEALFSAAASALLYAGLVALGMVSVLVVAQVIWSNAFDLGLPWADELARFGGVDVVFLSLPRLLLDGNHIAVDLLPNALPPAKRAILMRINGLLTVVFCAGITWGLFKFLERAGKFSTPAMEIPNWLYYLPAVLGLGLFGLIALYRLFAATPLPAARSGTEPVP